MNQLTIAAISCVITILIKETAFLLLKIHNPNVIIDFVIFTVIFISIFTLIEKFAGKKENNPNGDNNGK